jgi:hypothetical protein
MLRARDLNLSFLSFNMKTVPTTDRLNTQIKTYLLHITINLIIIIIIIIVIIVIFVMDQATSCLHRPQEPTYNITLPCSFISPCYP